MSTFETAHQPNGTAARAAAFLSVARARLRESLAGFVAARRARRTAWILHGLSDHELKDIGISRCDIDRIASGEMTTRFS